MSMLETESFPQSVELKLLNAQIYHSLTPDLILLSAIE